MLEEIPQLLPGHGGQHLEVLDPDRDRLAVGAPAEPADLLDEIPDRPGLIRRQVREPPPVDDRLGPPADAPQDLREQSLGAHLVELGQGAEALEGDGSLRPLVSRDRGGLELSLRPRTDIPERQAASSPRPPEGVPRLLEDLLAR